LSAVIVGKEVDILAVGRKLRFAGDAVERQGEDLGFTAGGGGDGYVLGCVFKQTRLDLGNVSDPFAVGRPGRRVV
jgi:hypothetical protein